MTLLHAHHDDLGGELGEAHLSIAAVIRRLVGLLKMLHRGIVVAKMRRLRCELMFHPRHADDASREESAAGIPQTPLILDGKWDF